MTHENDCLLELRLHRPFYEADTIITINIGPEHRLMLNKSDVVAGIIPLVPLETAVDLIKQRILGSQTIKDTAKKLGALMAERLEDEHGWHGEDREEKTKAIRR